MSDALMFDLCRVMTRSAAQKRVEEVGIMKACAEAKVSREAYCRVLGGLRVQRGTVLAMAHALGQINSERARQPEARAVSSLPTVGEIG